MALCGISLDLDQMASDEQGASSNASGGSVAEFGCPLLTRLGVTDCANISAAGVGSCLRNLPDLNALYYSRLVAAIETVAVIDGDYIRGKRRLNITHLDQFSEYYEFENHPSIVPLITKV